MTDTPFTSFAFAASGFPTSRTMPARLAEIRNVKDFGAVGDGTTHPLSSYFGSLAAAQAVYPHADSLTNEIDWAASQLAVDYNTVFATTTVSAAAGTNTFTLNAVPSTINTSGGFALWDKSRPAVIPPGTTVTNIAGNVITLSNTILGNGVASGDTIRFDFSHRGEIFFPTGDYLFDRTLSLDRLLSIYLRGSGTKTILRGASIVPQAGTSQGYTIDKSPVYNPAAGPIIIEKMRVVGGNANYGAIRISSSIGVAVRDVVAEGRVGVDTSSSTTCATATINAGGSGHAVGNVITLGGGTTTRPVKLTVTAVSGGAITAVVITDVGEYTAFPSSTNTPTAVAQSATTGSGTGSTFDLFIGGASQSVEVTDVTWTGGSGSTSCGVVIGANGSVANFDSTGGGKTGIAAYGVGVNLINNRCEVLDTGIALGVNHLLYNLSLSGFTILGGSCESCLTAIDFLGGTGTGLISGVKIQGYLDAGPGGADPVYGINYRSDQAHHVVTMGVSVGGAYTGAAVNVEDAFNPKFLTFISNEFGNSTGPNVNMPTKAHIAQWINNSGQTAPVYTLANLPSSPLEGDKYSISNGAKTIGPQVDATFGEVVIGSGTQHCEVRWDGTNWRRCG